MQLEPKPTTEVIEISSDSQGDDPVVKPKSKRRPKSIATSISYAEPPSPTNPTNRNVKISSSTNPNQTSSEKASNRNLCSPFSTVSASTVQRKLKDGGDANRASTSAGHSVLTDASEAGAVPGPRSAIDLSCDADDEGDVKATEKDIKMKSVLAKHHREEEKQRLLKRIARLYEEIDAKQMAESEMMRGREIIDVDADVGVDTENGKEDGEMGI